MTPTRQQAEQEDAGQAGADLPIWDLSDLYRSMDAPEIERDLSAADDGADGLIEMGRGKLAGMDGAALAEFIGKYEKIEDLLGRVYSYASLLHSAKSDDAEISRFYQTVRERINDIGTKLLFVTLEINKIADADLEAKVSSADGLDYYRPWLRDIRSFSAPTSSMTRSSAYCMRNRSPGALPGTACSTRPWRAYAFRSTTKT